jgi:hypothetical protein
MALLALPVAVVNGFASGALGDGGRLAEAAQVGNDLDVRDVAHLLQAVNTPEVLEILEIYFFAFNVFVTKISVDY